MIRLRTPRCDEAAILTELCIRSKAVWGYDEEFMHACRGELTLTASIMQSSSVKVAEIDGHLVGVTQVTVKGELAELNKLFVEPPCLRSGAGKALFEWAKTVARDAGAATMVIEADPDAAGFYRRMGAVEKGTAPSGSIPGRLLPRLELGLSPMPAERIFQVVVDWARTQPTIQAVAMVGSYARGQARPDSDLDLVFTRNQSFGLPGRHRLASCNRLERAQRPPAEVGGRGLWGALVTRPQNPRRNILDVNADPVPLSGVRPVDRPGR